MVRRPIETTRFIGTWPRIIRRPPRAACPETCKTAPFCGPGAETGRHGHNTSRCSQLHSNPTNYRAPSRRAQIETIGRGIAGSSENTTGEATPSQIGPREPCEETCSSPELPQLSQTEKHSLPDFLNFPHVSLLCATCLSHGSCLIGHNKNRLCKIEQFT